MLSKKISYDEKVSKLSTPAALFYTWCIPHLDVEGRIYGEPEILKGTVVPYIKDIKLEKISKLQQEMVDADLVILYGNDHKYMEFKGFHSNQTINKDREAPSEIPAPTQLLINSGITPAKVNISKVNISKDMSLSFLSYYNEKTKKHFRPTKSNLDLINSRLKDGFTVEQLKMAVDNFVKDDWVDRHKYMDLIYCIGKQRGKPDNLERWINWKPAPEKTGIDKWEVRR